MPKKVIQDKLVAQKTLLEKYIMESFAVKIISFMHTALSKTKLEKLQDASDKSNTKMLQLCLDRTEKYIERQNVWQEHLQGLILTLTAQLQKGLVLKKSLRLEKEAQVRELVQLYEVKALPESITQLIERKKKTMLELGQVEREVNACKQELMDREKELFITQVHIKKFHCLTQSEHIMRSFKSLVQPGVSLEQLSDMAHFGLQLECLENNPAWCSVGRACINSAFLIDFISGLHETLAGCDENTVQELIARSEVALEYIGAIYGHKPRLDSQNEPQITLDPQEFSDQFLSLVLNSEYRRVIDDSSPKAFKP